MANRNRNRKQPKRLAENENDPKVQRLLSYGGQVQSSHPVPGLMRALTLIAPPAVRVALKYSSRLSLTSTVGVYAEHNFAGNGLFDPDVTGVGTQPTGFDQWCAFYQRFRVLASHCRVQAINPTAATNAASMADISLVPTNTTTAFANSDIAASQPYCKRTLANTIGMGPNGPTRLESMMETDLILGVSKEAVLSELTYSGSASTNPADNWYWRICQEPADAASTQTIIYEVVITYLVDFFERQLNVASATSSSSTPKQSSPGKLLPRATPRKD
jgi:hypothetical protein